jgi:hypothetical protein
MLHVNDDVVVAGEGEELDQGRVGRMRGGGFVCVWGGGVISVRVGKKERRKSEECKVVCTVWKERGWSYTQVNSNDRGYILHTPLKQN